MDFGAFREQQVAEGKVKFQEKCDGWDPCHTPRKAVKPTFVRLQGKVYQEIEGRLVALHGK